MKKNIAIIVLALLFAASLTMNALCFRGFMLDEKGREYMKANCSEMYEQTTTAQYECLVKGFGEKAKR